MKMPANDLETVDVLETLTAEIHRMVRDGTLSRLRRGARRRLLHRVQRLYGSLGKGARPELVRLALAATAILAVGAGCREPGPGEPGPIAFKAPVSNPFEIQALSGPVCPAFHDIDGDGDQDLFVTEEANGVRYFKNVGSATSPLFSLQVDNLGLPDSAGNTPYSTIAFLDADSDDTVEAFLGDWGYSYAEIRRYEYKGGVFEEDTTPAGLPGMQDWEGRGLIMAAGDLDGDGDQDVVIVEAEDDYAGGAVSTLSYKKSSGSDSFTDQADTMGLEDYTGGYAFPFFADIDGDDDLDALFSNDEGEFEFFLNSGTPTSAAFDPPVAMPFDLVAVTGPAVVTVVDIDADGDLDVFVGEGDGDIKFFENTSLPIPDAE